MKPTSCAEDLLTNPVVQAIFPSMNSQTPTSLQRGKSVIQGYVKTLPTTPGVYRMISERDQVLYVGKAKSLKSRVTSYTLTDKLPLRLQRMVSEVHRMEFVTTHTEVEALLLEANLIKKFEPRYNILLRDDKMFSFIRIGATHDFPLVSKHRGVRTPPDDYYGPFASGTAVNMTLNTLHRAFLLRSCSDHVFQTRTRPCLQYQIKRCSAPCVGKVSKEEYALQVREAKDFLQGKSSTIQKQMAEKMQAASAAQNYEDAAQYRDRIRALTHIQGKQSIYLSTPIDADIFAIACEEGVYCIQLFLFRKGCNYGTHAVFPKHTEDMETSEVMTAYLTHFYQDAPPPPLVLVNTPLATQDLVTEALSQTAGRKVEIRIPKSGELAKLMKSAVDNAQNALGRQRAESASQKKLLDLVASTFDMDQPPSRIEIYDNSHIQGQFPVGCMVVAGSEGFLKNAYRKFNIKSKDITPGDDFGMMREVLIRRFSRALAQDKDETSQWPDLVIIDGGAGQLSSVQSVFDDLGVTDVKLVAIAKGPDRNAGREDFYMKERSPFKLKPDDPVLYYMQRLRDEAHRFAIGFHRQKRIKNITRSKLDDVPGIGAKRKRALLEHFGSAKEVMNAGIDDLASVEGISLQLAQTLYEFFHS